MEIYTSYWANVRKFPPNLVGLNTTIWPPKWRPFGEDKRGVLVIDCPPFKPGPQCAGLCNGKCAIKDPDHCKFLDTYYCQLEDLDCVKFINNLERISNQLKQDKGFDDVDFALIVYEAPTNECSERQAIWRWGAWAGFEIKEWKPNT